jgi:hypothetical protein
VAAFYRVRRHLDTGAAGDLANFEFALWRLQTRTALQTLQKCSELTPLGSRLVDTLLATVERWLDEPVPAGAAAAAREAAEDHAAAWRAYHLCPDPGAVRAASDDWLAGRAAAAVDLDRPATVRPDPAARWLDSRAVLTRLRLADPAAFDELRRAAADVDLHVAGATRADLAYAAGDVGAAQRLYAAELSARPDRAGAWAGLGLALAASRFGPASSALLRHPEFVRAVARAVAAATGEPAAPVRLAEWVGGAGRAAG